MYGQPLFGTLAYGDNPDETNPPEIDAPDLMNYLPNYYADSRIMRSIQGAAAAELGSLRYALDAILAQLFVRTASWGLDRWERELGIDYDPSRPNEWRREIILAKLRGGSTTTKAKIVNVAAAFSGGEVEVIEYPDEYRFVVRFIGILGIPPNMAGFVDMLEQIKPAHLAYSFMYTFTTWSMISDLTWADAVSKTWNELRVYEGA
ncbi:putative phage tail protein [Paenibacillus cymbidii]|uniref:putative phage tail protein n=1 Tax=Paenibacillus cymbidii TaxID=1639034 RepID=UPI001080CBBB|nr:putative phage tail protein [Paenibacillus cymbidii]